MKTVEVIGFFNEFKYGALAPIRSKRLNFGDQQTLKMIVDTNMSLIEQDEPSSSSSDKESKPDDGEEADVEASVPQAPQRQETIKARLSEVDSYIDYYMRWRGLAESKIKKEKEEAKGLRDQMRHIEDTVDFQQILPLRQAAI